MSYDLAVFEPTAAPRAPSEFSTWYDQQTAWAEQHSYDNPAVASPALRAFYQAMISQFPPMNGPDRSSEWNSKVSDYSIGQSIIYIAFAWSQAEEAYGAVRAAAEAAGVGFLDASGPDGEIWLPNQPA